MNNKTKIMLLRGLFIIIGLALLAFGVYRFIITFGGKTAEARVTGVEVSYDYDSEYGDSTTVTTSYEFEVDGVTYTGKADETVDFDEFSTISQEFVAERQNKKTVQVRYLPSRPQSNDLDVNSKPSFFNNLISGFLTFLGLAFVLGGIFGKPITDFE